ncbi:MAG TPA: hypothetical protein DCW68_07380 [Rhodospirillaceae bacterium]|nr:MAG: hypothetical protein A2018_06890 [Alphaproteobacteria bacterium GWF2_58_20]HAU29908.1 hypothetical protein [Rhodospirillaceae bacterium]
MRGTFKYLYALAGLAFAAPYIDPQTFAPGTELSAPSKPAVIINADALLPVDQVWDQIKNFDSRRLAASISEPNDLTMRLGIRVPTLARVNQAWAGLARYSQLGPESDMSGFSDTTLQNRFFDASDAAADGFVRTYSGE